MLCVEPLYLSTHRIAGKHLALCLWQDLVKQCLKTCGLSGVSLGGCGIQAKRWRLSSDWGLIDEYNDSSF